MDGTNEATPLAFSGQQVGGEALISPGFLILFTPLGLHCLPPRQL